MSQKKKTKRPKLWKIILTVVLLIIVGIIIGISIMFNFSEEEETLNSSLLENQIQNAQELTTTKYHYKNAGTFENQEKFYNWNVPFTKKNFILTYSGVIHAGVNLDQVVVDVSEAEIVVDLPEAQILSHEIDEESLNILDENSSVFNQLEITDVQNFAVEQESVIEAEAIDKGLLEEANRLSQDAVTTILQLNPAMAEEDYTITFE